MKAYKCECIYVLHPFGNGMPICARKMLETKDRKDLMHCDEKKCDFYKAQKTTKGKRNEKVY